MSEHGGNMEESKILSATRRVAEVFVQEASLQILDLSLQSSSRFADFFSSLFFFQADDFASYEEYCAGHDEALLVIRQVESTPEWISYERRCSNLARSRTRQTLTRLLSSPTASYAGRLPLPSATAPTTPISTSFPDDVSSRLMLRDLLIKPVQRICRYPLVLASLLGSQLPREGGGGELERALGGMKEVAQGVDEATRRKAAKGRTDVIIERMEAHPVSSSSLSCALRVERTTLTPCLPTSSDSHSTDSEVARRMRPRRIPGRHLPARSLRSPLPSRQGPIPRRLPLQRIPPPLQGEEGKGLPGFLLHAVEVGEDRRWPSGWSRRFVPFPPSFLEPRLPTDLLSFRRCSSSSGLLPSRRPRVLLRARHLRSEGERHMARRTPKS